MQPFCAVCEQSFGQGEPYSLWGQYVVHRRCYGQKPKNEVYLTSVRHQVAELDLAVSQERQAAERMAKDLETRIRRLRDERDHYQSEATRWTEATSFWTARNNEAVSRNAQLQEQIDRLRQVQVAQVVPVATPGITSTQEAEEATPDDTQTRFSLLEFD